MRICILGTGYVGLTTGVFLSSLGHKVCCMDSDRFKIAELLEGRVPLFEPGLEEMLREQVLEGRLYFTTDLDLAMEECEFCFIAVGTPPAKDGSADVSQVVAAAREISQRITRPATVVIKSTIPPGTTERVRNIIQEELQSRQLGELPVYIVFNPEFLREGEALRDTAHPDRIILGTDNPQAVENMRSLYKPQVAAGIPLLTMDPASAEMSKYAANIMLACRISLMNELAGLCDAVGADISEVRRGMALDPRIGGQFLNAGIGYGGSCLPKDVAAMIDLGGQYSVPVFITSGIKEANHQQRLGFTSLITRRFGEDLKRINLGVWGLSFKPGTDDLREAPSLDIISRLLARGACIDAFDPVANLVWPEPFNAQFKRVLTMQEAVQNKDALLLLTEWPCFSTVDFAEMARVMRKCIIFDGRNLYDPEMVRRHGFEYYCIGRSCLRVKEVG